MDGGGGGTVMIIRNAMAEDWSQCGGSQGIWISTKPRPPRSFDYQGRNSNCLDLTAAEFADSDVMLILPITNSHPFAVTWNRSLHLQCRHHHNRSRVSLEMEKPTTLIRENEAIETVNSSQDMPHNDGDGLAMPNTGVT